MRNRLASIEDLSRYVHLTPSEINGIRMAQGRFPVAITPYWASLLDPSNPRCPLRLQVIPTAQEHLVSKHEMLDPLA
ncbi:MAG TPA: lysine 2,3-aminomutase, partial [Candidatus Polarisedimenticolia bacterium]|nr:lysine 2,3-aminomutase [Candidatus Polarisedimenticolia bacterium]